MEGCCGDNECRSATCVDSLTSVGGSLWTHFVVFALLDVCFRLHHFAVAMSFPTCDGLHTAVVSHIFSLPLLCTLRSFDGLFEAEWAKMQNMDFESTLDAPDTSDQLPDAQKVEMRREISKATGLPMSFFSNEEK